MTSTYSIQAKETLVTIYKCINDTFTNVHQRPKFVTFLHYISHPAPS